MMCMHFARGVTTHSHHSNSSADVDDASVVVFFVQTIIIIIYPVVDGEASHTISPRVPVSQTLNIAHTTTMTHQPIYRPTKSRERERPLPRPLLVTSYHRAYSTHAVGFIYPLSYRACPVHETLHLVPVEIPSATSSFKVTTKRRRFSMIASCPPSITFAPTPNPTQLGHPP